MTNRNLIIELGPWGEILWCRYHFLRLVSLATLKGFSSYSSFGLGLQHRKPSYSPSWIALFFLFFCAVLELSKLLCVEFFVNPESSYFLSLALLLCCVIHASTLFLCGLSPSILLIRMLCRMLILFWFWLGWIDILFRISWMRKLLRVSQSPQGGGWELSSPRSVLHVHAKLSASYYDYR